MSGTARASPGATGGGAAGAGTTVGPMSSAPGADAVPSDGSRGLAKRGRLAVIIAVVVVAMAVAFVVQRRRVDDFEHTLTRAQVSARAAGDSIDLTTFPARWAADPLGERDAVVPPIEGTRVANVTASSSPPRVVVDYEIVQGGQTACVRVTRTPSGTEVTDAEVACADFTFSPTL